MLTMSRSVITEKSFGESRNVSELYFGYAPKRHTQEFFRRFLECFGAPYPRNLFGTVRNVSEREFDCAPKRHTREFFRRVSECFGTLYKTNPFGTFRNARSYILFELRSAIPENSFGEFRIVSDRHTREMFRKRSEMFRSAIPEDSFRGTSECFGAPCPRNLFGTFRNVSEREFDCAPKRHTREFFRRVSECFGALYKRNPFGTFRNVRKDILFEFRSAIPENSFGEFRIVSERHTREMFRERSEMFRTPYQ